MALPKKKSFDILRLYFTAYVFAILGTTVVGSALITFLLNTFVSATVVIPTFVWILLFSVALGGVLTGYLSKWILAPLTRLSNAMSRVAAGDFTVRLESATKIRELQDTYANFNLMVRGLSATETLQSDFISNVSHEFKTPINAIEGYAMLLQDRNQTVDEQQEYVEKILFNTRRLSELVGNILLLSKVDNQAIEANKTNFRLDEQIRQAILSLEQKWSDKQIEFDVDLEPLMVCGNENLLLHVWTNLIDNAIKFDPYGGAVKIRLMRDAGAGHVTCFVEDSGPGIPADARAHIFERFYQADSSHKEEGNGLGLALVKRILDTAGGSIKIESAPDCGSSFTVTLPLL
ncbi:Signal transduction histidine-protein kinase ArlS [bioreactor metagenome]|uniref:histidine kinase n=1 Tax=bioreactor metagenome TaxID=1076179 RepID=A0A645D392_9ZZZZ|nr:HAMP domain-containing sensor histidine kinase [Candidatus Pelethousia sp.]